MKKFNKAKLLSILVMIFILVGFMPTICKADEKTEENKSITMNVSYGIDGNFKGSREIPINIELENKGEDIEGQVEVRVPTNITNTYDAFISEINLGAKEKRTITIPINLLENCSKISVAFTQGEIKLSEKEVLLSNGRVNDNDLFMGILTDDYNGISIKDLDFSDLNIKNKHKYINKIVNVPLDLDSLTKSSKNISSLDVIVINNYNISNLQKEQYENLSTWINNGGILIIGSGENSPKTIANIDKEFLDVAYNGTKDINGYTLSNLNLKDASITLQERENPLIYLINQGKGKVYIGAFDLSNEKISSKDNVLNTWKEYLNNDFINKQNSHNRRGSYVPYQMEELSNTVPIKEDINMKLFILIFASYALIVGIIIYFIMKKLKKRDWLWGVIPIIAIGFSLLLYIIGSSTRIQDLVLNQVNIIKTDENGTSSVNGYIGIGNKYKDNLIVEEPNGTSIQMYDGDNYYNDDDKKDKFTKLRSKIVYRENNSYYEFKDLSALQMKNFEVSGYKGIVPSIETNFNYDAQELVGEIRNLYGYDIEKLLVVSSNNVWDLGKVKANEEKTITSNTISASGLTSYSDNLRSSYYNDYRHNSNNKKNKEEYKDILRISSLIESIEEQQLSSKSTYLVAITDMPIDYGFDFGEKSVSKFDTTAIIQDLNINFADKEGNLNYPLGYFKGEIVQSDPNIDINMHNNEIMGVHGSGELIVDYSVDKEMTILDLKVGYGNNQDLSSLKGTAYVYNYEKNDYDKINYTADGENLKNSSQYIKDGKVTVKLNCTDEDGIGIPQITVKGRAK